MDEVVKVDPQNPGAYAAFLEPLGKEYLGFPVYLGYDLNDLACGFLAADCLNISATIEWICVDIRHRREGIGGQLLDEFCSRAFNAGMEAVYVYLDSERMDLATAEPFFISHGFRCTESSTEFVFTLKNLLEGRLGAAVKKTDPHICPLRKVAPRFWKRYKQNINYVETDEDNLLDLSVVYADDTEIKGCLLLTPYGEGVNINWLQSDDPGVMFALMAGACKNLSEISSDDLMIYATGMHPGVGGIIKRLTGNKAQEHGYLLTYLKTL